MKIIEGLKNRYETVELCSAKGGKKEAREREAERPVQRTCSERERRKVLCMV